MVRHGQAIINEMRGEGEIETAVGHSTSPLTDKGIAQSIELGRVRIPKELGVWPPEYDRPVAVSELLRPQQTMQYAGFSKMHILPVLNELVPPPELVEGRKAIEKHAAERWAPDDGGQAREFIDGIRSGHYNYEFYGSHGLFIAKVMLGLEEEVGPENFPHEFDPNRGFIPLQTAMVALDI